MGPGREIPAQKNEVEVISAQHARMLHQEVAANWANPEAAMSVFNRYRNTYWKTPSGSLRKVFPRKPKQIGGNHAALVTASGEKRVSHRSH